MFLPKVCLAVDGSCTNPPPESMMRQLTETEKKFCAETGVDADLAAGARIDHALIHRTDPASIAGEGFSPHHEVLRQIQSIEVSGEARFGNYVMKLANAFELAKATGIRHIIHPGIEFMPDECEVRGVRFSTRPCQALRRIVSPSYYHRTLQPLTHGSTSKASVMKALASVFSLERPASTDQPAGHLVIHVRSGDVFSSAPHPYYAQPPWAFYQYVLSHREWSGVTLVYEDTCNPVIGRLCEHLGEIGIPFIMQSGTLLDDLQTLLAARNLVIGRGTFAYPVIAMSRLIERVYCFDNYHDDSFEKPLWAHRIDGVRFEKLIDVGQTYRDQVLAKWENSAEQRRLMLEYPVTSLAKEENGDPVTAASPLAA